MINRSANTICSELKRGTVPQVKAGKITSSYFAQTGQSIYAKNRKNCGSKYKLLKSEKFIDHVYKFFYENKHSFDSITGSCRISESFTADNGLEFSKLSTLEKASSVRVYFAPPYSSGERGTNERHNGLIRRIIPKGRSIKVQNWCNSLPRKILGYLTPDQVFEDQMRALFYQ